VAEAPSSSASVERTGQGDGHGLDGGATASAASAAARSAEATASVRVAPGPPFVSEERFDLLIRGGVVVDGTGGPRMRADVLVRGERIVHVGQVDRAVKAERVIDARGRIVSPGFIDTHAHGDPARPNRNFLAQGVTTICLGMDGRSPSQDRIRYWRGRVGKQRLAVNVVPFVGHGTVRNLAKVGIRKDPTPKQIERMARLVEKEMDAGAFGLSMGLEYQPGSFATLEELVAIARPVAERGGVVMSHMRSEDDDRIDAAIDELLAQGKASGARVHVSHIKVVYGRGAERAEQILARLDKARDEGLGVSANLYPYNASYTGIGIVFPDFAKPPHRYSRVKRERRAELAAYLRERVALRGGPEATLFGTPPWAGKTLAEWASELGKPFEDVLIDDIGPGGVSAAYFVMDDALQSRLLLDPHVMVCTDGSEISRHPRGYGAFARVIRKYVVERQALSLEEAVRKMSDLPARTVGLDRYGRGRLAEDYAADIAIFDPDRVRDRATYQEPNRRAEGFDWVFVNGRAVVAEGKLARARPGKLILRR